MTQTPAQSRIARLSGLDFFPVIDEAILELANALQRLGGEERQDEFVSDWLDESRKAPTPADVRSWGVSHQQEAVPVVGSEPKCELCGDTGWRYDFSEGRIVPAVKRCGCRGGAG